jgi:hypothetical protein
MKNHIQGGYVLENILFFDIEVYPFDSFVIIKDKDRNSKLFHDKNRFEGLGEFIKGATLVGYNNYWYDDHILCAMLDGRPQSEIKELNDRIIGGQKQYPKNRFKSLDCFQQIDVGMPSLKKIEGNRGKRILESSVPFDLPRPMTKEEYREAVDYCSYDVDNTIDIYELRINSYFAPKQSLVEMVGKGEKWNTTTLSANALLGNKTLTKWSGIRLNGEDFQDLSMLELVPQEVRDLWNGDEWAESKMKTTRKVTIEEFGCSIEFGFGGLHGVHKTQKKVKNMKLLDVASMYPNIILIINALGTATSKYKDILDRRIRVKHLDKILSDALKLILNSVYGNLKNQYSSLYNPKAALSVCIYGQIALYVLCKRLAEDGHTIININTDGVGFVPKHDGYKQVWEQWEKDFKLDLEEDSFDLIQKDVNNYIGVKDGKVVKTKGGDVGRYYENIEKGIHSFFKNGSARIVDIALVEHLVHGKSIIDTLVENLDNPRLYQYIIQAGGTYQGTFDACGNKYNKVNRVFPTRKGDLCLYKKRHDDGLVRFPDLPEKMFVWNDDLDKLEDMESFIDLNHYMLIIQKKLERWV